MDNADIISFVVVILFSIVLGLFFAWLFGGILIPRAMQKKAEKKAIKRIEEQEEQGYEFYDDGKKVEFTKIIKEGLENVQQS